MPLTHTRLTSLKHETHAGGTRPLASLGTLALVPAMLLLGCRSTEEEIIDRYLTAQSRGESSTVAALSMVAFTEDFTDWRVLDVGPIEEEPYEVPALRERVNAAEDERDLQFKDFGRFRQENYDDLARIQKQLRENPDQHFTGKLLELNETWEEYRQARREVVARLQDAELELERAIRRVEKSLQRESSPEYLTGKTQHRTILVRVTTLRGDRHYDFVLTRYELENQFGAVVPARWIITGFEESARQPSGD